MSEFLNDQSISNSFCAETDLTATHKNDLVDQYPVTFPPIVPNSSCSSRQYGSNVQASAPHFDDHWNTPNQSSDSSQNNQQVSTSCSPNSSLFDASPSLTLPTPISSKSSISNLDACPPYGATMNTADLLSRNEKSRRNLTYKGIYLTQQMFSTLVLRKSKLHYRYLLIYTKPWETLTAPRKKLFIRIYNWLNLDDVKKREYLEISESLGCAETGYPQNNQQISNSCEPISSLLASLPTASIANTVSSEASVPNLDACPAYGTVLNTKDLLSRSEEIRRKFTYKGMCLTKQMFSRLVLRRAHCRYARLFNCTRPWETLAEPGRELYVRIHNWLKLNDDKKREYLEIMEIKEELKNQMDSSEKTPKQKKNRTAPTLNPDAQTSSFTSTIASKTSIPILDAQTSFSTSPVPSKASIPNLDIYPPQGTTIITTDLIIRNEESRRNLTYKDMRLTQQMFSTLVLRKSPQHYCSLLKYTKPWESLWESGKEPFIRIFNWLKLDDDKKREYLEIMEIKEELKKVMDSSEEIAKQQKVRTSSIPNLDACPPEGTILIPTDLLSQNEENRRNLSYKGRFLTKIMFSTLVLNKSQDFYPGLFKDTKPWETLTASRKTVFIRIYNWLELDDDKKREYLEIMEIKEELKKVVDSSEEMAKQNKIQTASIPNLDAVPPEGTILIPTDLLSQSEENRRNLTYKGRCLTQQMFSSLVLGKTQGHYCTLLKYTKPWKSLTKQGKKLFIRIFNWLNLEDDKKREYLEIMEIKEELKKVVDEKMAKQNKIQTASIPNLDTGRNYYEQEATDRV
ncbi:unnamed protein product [Caenorhabditis nigoni]